MVVVGFFRCRLLLLLLLRRSRGGILDQLAGLICEVCERRGKVLLVDDGSLVRISLGALGSSRFLGFGLAFREGALMREAG